ncbi:hypothetical protein CC78DRAFT_541236 [Lojkania enalia]|uniref:Uncharacterized protein n=1 Tax=Lojkania enalia TaxID=147567 RepID=A0A9P4KF56_9PLEO|nr:hypothetical protein CC78DRAFT_541236 [Didymosphaeria enalia]
MSWKWPEDGGRSSFSHGQIGFTEVVVAGGYRSNISSSRNGGAQSGVSPVSWMYWKIASRWSTACFPTIFWLTKIVMAKRIAMIKALTIMIKLKAIARIAGKKEVQSASDNIVVELVVEIGEEKKGDSDYEELGAPKRLEDVEIVLEGTEPVESPCLDDTTHWDGDKESKLIGASPEDTPNEMNRRREKDDLEREYFAFP